MTMPPFDIKTLLLFVNSLVIPCFVWVWRVSSTQRLLGARMESLQKEMSAMPTHETIHRIETSIVRIEGSIAVVATEVKSLKSNQARYEKR